VNANNEHNQYPLGSNDVLIGIGRATSLAKYMHPTLVPDQFHSHRLCRKSTRLVIRPFIFHNASVSLWCQLPFFCLKLTDCPSLPVQVLEFLPGPGRLLTLLLQVLHDCSLEAFGQPTNPNARQTIAPSIGQIDQSAVCLNRHRTAELSKIEYLDESRAGGMWRLQDDVVGSSKLLVVIPDVLGRHHGVFHLVVKMGATENGARQKPEELTTSVAAGDLAPQPTLGKRHLVVEAQAGKRIGFGGNACTDDLGAFGNQEAVLENEVEHHLGSAVDCRKFNQRRNVHSPKDLDHNLGREDL